MAGGSFPREIEDQAMVGLNLTIPSDAREDHLGAPSETGKIVMPHRADGDQTFTLDGARVETKG